MTWPLAIAALLAAQQAPPVDRSFDRYLEAGRLVEVERGRRLNLRCEGSGSPTIILESGLGFPSLSWRHVQPRLARLARTCSYDRAGLGFSDPGPMPRSAAAIADDLERLVTVANLSPPYLLVGNSMGGQSIRLFAFRRPSEIAGLVLVDPYVEGQYQTLARVDASIGDELRQLAQEEAACMTELRAQRLSAEAAEARGCIADADPAFSPELVALLRRQRLAPAGFEAAYSESRMLETQSERELARERRDLGDVPIIVLSASRNFASQRFARTREALLAEQARLHATLAALSRRGEVRPIDASHVVQSSSPSAVAEAVREILGSRTSE